MTTPTPITQVTFHMSQAFVQELTGSSTGHGTAGGSWAYIFNNKPPSQTGNWTTLIDNGIIHSPSVSYNPDNNDYEVTITLTNEDTPRVKSGALYLLVQSEDSTNRHDLPSLIGSDESLIYSKSAHNPDLYNFEAWHYGIAQFEYTLKQEPADQADLTSIPGFGWSLGVKIDDESRGYGLTRSALVSDLSHLKPDSVVTYSEGFLQDKTQFVISPATDPVLYESSDWRPYIDAIATRIAPGSGKSLTLSGHFQGANDASGIWHNAAYYSYSVSSTTLHQGDWGQAGTYFLFSPNAGSQVKGYVLIHSDQLIDNIYAPGQGHATLWQDAEFHIPYTIPGSGFQPFVPPTRNEFLPASNNEWGNLFTPLVTGFNAGYWGAIAQQSNPMNRSTTNNQAAGSIDLDNTINQFPSYAFDVNRINPQPAYQHSSPYTQKFFDDTNAYGSAFSDALSVGLTPGPLIPVGKAGGDVSNIDLYVYGSDESNAQYTQPTGANYLPPGHGNADYLIPTAPSGNLELVVTAGGSGVFMKSDVTMQLGIYVGNGQFTYVPIQTTSNAWQNYSVTGSSSGWLIQSGGSNLMGTFIISNLPTTATTQAGQVYWYQLVVTDSSNETKVYDIYAKATNDPNEFDTTKGSTATDGGATATPYSAEPNQLLLDLHPGTSMPAGMLSFVYTYNAGNAYYTQPGAPVVGTPTLSGFQAIDGQNGTGLGQSPDGNVLPTPAPSITTDQGQQLQFAWTGMNNGDVTNAHNVPVQPSGSAEAGIQTYGMISAYTNKINAGNTAQIEFKKGSVTLATKLQAVADLDGQWKTPGTIALGNGIFEITMTELLPNGRPLPSLQPGMVPSPSGTKSIPLTMTVQVSEVPLATAAGGQALQLVTTGNAGDPNGNWIDIHRTASPSTLQQGAVVLLYATMADGTLIARDGHSGSDVTLASATRAKVGPMLSDGGADLLTLGQSIFLESDEQLRFAVLNKDGSINSSPSVTLLSQTDGSVIANVGGLGFVAKTNNDLGILDYLAFEQRMSDLPQLYLSHGAKVSLEVTGSAANTNTVGFVRMEIDPANGKMSVAGVQYGATSEFYDAVRTHLEADSRVTDGGRTFTQAKDWTVAGETGVYVPVMLAQNGDVFVVGSANSDGQEHIRLLGTNAFGFEDLTANRNSDFDYNDMIIGVTQLTQPIA